MKKQLAIIYLSIFALLAGVESGFCKVKPPWYQDPCYTNWLERVGCISDASIIFSSVNMSPTQVCIGSGLCATGNTRQTDGLVKGMRKYLAEATNCVNHLETNSTVSVLITNWWVVSGPGGYSDTGPGFTACFSPTNKGKGKVTFYLQYTNTDGCPNGLQKSQIEQEFSMNCPNVSYSAISADCGNTTGAYFKYCFDCGGSYYWSETVSYTASPQCNQGPIRQTQDPTPTSAGCITDEVDMLASPQDVLASCGSSGCTECISERNQVMFVGPYGNEKACTYTNTQAIAIQATDSTLEHGTVTIVSGSAVKQCNW